MKVEISISIFIIIVQFNIIVCFPGSQPVLQCGEQNSSLLICNENNYLWIKLNLCNSWCEKMYNNINEEIDLNMYKSKFGCNCIYYLFIYLF